MSRSSLMGLGLGACLSAFPWRRRGLASANAGRALRPTSRLWPARRSSRQPNVKTYGGFRFAESISYDAERDLYVAVNAGMAQDVVPNDGYVSLVNPDGTAHTLKWIGVNRNGLTLNHPLGSDIANGMLYVVDIDTVRWFDMKTGEPRGAIPVAGATRFNDLEVAADGTIYATQTGDHGAATSWRVYKITPKGESQHSRHRRAARQSQRHRPRCKRQHRGRQHRQQRGADVFA